MLMDPSDAIVGLTKNDPAKYVRSKEFLIGLLVSPEPETVIKPGVWKFVVRANIPAEIHFLGGALPYVTFAAGASLSESELMSLPDKWERDDGKPEKLPIEIYRKLMK
jgi:hypothetical protein